MESEHAGRRRDEQQIDKGVVTFGSASFNFSQTPRGHSVLLTGQQYGLYTT